MLNVDIHVCVYSIHTPNTCISRITTANKQNITQFLLLLLILLLLLPLILIYVVLYSVCIHEKKKFCCAVCIVLMFISCAVAVAQTAVNRIIHAMLFDIYSFFLSHTYKHAHNIMLTPLFYTFAYTQTGSLRSSWMFLMLNWLDDYFTRATANNECPKKEHDNNSQNRS